MGYAEGAAEGAAESAAEGAAEGFGEKDSALSTTLVSFTETRISICNASNRLNALMMMLSIYECN